MTGQTVFNKRKESCCLKKAFMQKLRGIHGLRMPIEEIAFTSQPKIYSHSQIFRYSGSIFCLPYRPNFPDTVFPRIVVATTILFLWLGCDNYSRETTIQRRKLLISFLFGWCTMYNLPNLNCYHTMYVGLQKSKKSIVSSFEYFPPLNNCRT